MYTPRIPIPILFALFVILLITTRPRTVHARAPPRLLARTDPGPATCTGRFYSDITRPSCLVAATTLQRQLREQLQPGIGPGDDEYARADYEWLFNSLPLGDSMLGDPVVGSRLRVPVVHVETTGLQAESGWSARLWVKQNLTSSRNTEACSITLSLENDAIAELASLKDIEATVTEILNSCVSTSGRAGWALTGAIGRLLRVTIGPMVDETSPPPSALSVATERFGIGLRKAWDCGLKACRSFNDCCTGSECMPNDATDKSLFVVMWGTEKQLFPGNFGWCTYVSSG
ncbi:MAG: hypothetical protein M1827_006228 [Pycnora praestabilis]|nr:MAG: hypothetical protein M1827_006228 [Pycnora praestabilis]